MKHIKCKHCGEEFKLTQEDIELHDEGHCDLPDTCQDCFDMIEGSQNMPDECYSDADPGL